MRIILSRKGFDSANGGMPSPIMPDGTLLSLPIPTNDGKVSYNSIAYQGKSYDEIIRELNPRIADELKDRKCHADPDLSCSYIEQPTDWKPAFGQCDVSQLHLQKYHIGAGDLFLFYGWFRQTEYDENGKLCFVKPKEDKTPDRHIIYGYMEIGEVLTEQAVIEKDYPWQPHSVIQSSDNALYLPKATLSLDNGLKGYGLLKNAPIRQLTKEGHHRSEWELPKYLRDNQIPITYHEGEKYGWADNMDYFQSARIGQEFIIQAEVEQHPELKKWLMEILSAN